MPMRVLIQRSKNACVRVDNKICGEISHGLVLLVGFEHEDELQDIDKTVKKIINLRIFSDENGKMNRDILESNGQFLVISQFTLHACLKKGNRPSYIRAARPEHAKKCYDYFVDKLREESQLPVETGKFGEHMEVELLNDGPVTIWWDSAAN